MTKTQRLYGEHVDPRRWKTMGYIDVLEDKIRLAGLRIQDLNLLPLIERDDYNIKECIDAIKWCNDMIKETESVC